MKSHFLILSLSATLVVASTGCMGGGGRMAHNLPPASRLMEPGPGVGGPGPGVIQPASAIMAGRGGMAAGIACQQSMAGSPCGPGGPGGPAGPPITSQIAFLGVEGAEVAWDVTGQGMFDSAPLIMPGRQNFMQGAIYRLKLINVPDRPGVELYPTLEIAPVTPRTDAFLAHSPIPMQFTNEDLDQVQSGNFVTKVIYLPDPEFQELALAGVETLVSTRLDPGVDPIAEADRRGSILAILRIGNLDLQLPSGIMADTGIRRAQHFEDSEEALDSQNQGPLQPYNGDLQYEGSVPYEGDAAISTAPRGMRTAGFAPQVVPPGAMSGIGGPQWGSPITGTPIGLPGPPHIPLGSPAGLTKHVMKNHTRVLMPPPVHKMRIDVKQRPGMNYPRPVNHVNINETNRAGFRLFGGTMPGLVTSTLHKAAARVAAPFKRKDGDECSTCQ
jgi:hypothetical protein